MNKFKQSLLIVSKEGETHIPLTEKLITIGRDGLNTIILPDKEISRTHAILKLDNGKYSIKDSDSANGVIINKNHKLRQNESWTLQNGDTLLLGNCLLIYSEIIIDDLPLSKTSYLCNAAELLRSSFTSELPPNLSTFSSTQELRLRETNELNISELKEENLEILQKRSQILSFIYELNKSLNHAFSLEEMYKSICNSIFKVTDCGRIAFVTLKNTGNNVELQVNWTEYFDDDTKQDYQLLSISHTVVKKVIEEKVSISTDPLSDTTFSQTQSFTLGTIRSVMCVPMLGQQNAVLGAIYVDRIYPTQFSEDDVNFLTAVAANTATAIERISTHEKLLQEAERRLVYSRFLPPFVVEEIVAAPKNLRLGGINKEVTVLFADIRGFTTLSENKEPQEIVSLLNNYFERAVDAIFKHNGTLDKFIGDGIMAFFGAPNSSKSDPVNAILTAIAIQREVQQLNKELELNGTKHKLEVGIGINTGKVTAGYIGSTLRTDYTVIGDTVNIASRLESTASAGQILIGEQTYLLVQDYIKTWKKTSNTFNSLTPELSIFKEYNFSMRSMGSLQVKGMKQTVKTYRVFWSEAKNIPPKSNTSSLLGFYPDLENIVEKTPENGLSVELYVSGIDTDGKPFDNKCVTETFTRHAATITLDFAINIGEKIFFWGEDGVFQAQARVADVKPKKNKFLIEVNFDTKATLFKIK